MHFFSAVSDNNTDPIIIWWWLRRRKKRGQRKRNLFFCDDLNSGAYIVSKERKQNPELFKSFYQVSIENFSLWIL
jgi:hypothetical protein